MAADKKDLIYCEKCHRTLKRGEFYQSNNLEKYPDGGTIPICKKCLTMHVDNWDASTFTPILKEVDVPYIPEEWNKLLAKYGQDKRKVTGMTILGRYLSKMKLNQYKQYRWKDTDFLQELAEKRLRESMERQGKDIQEITLAIEEQKAIIPEEKSFEEVVYADEPAQVDEPETFATMDFAQEPTKTADDLGLTEEDVTYLKLKWGKSYKPEEWVQLEQYYNDFMESYDIQTAGHKDTLKKLAKTSLKLDQLIDLGDVDGAQKMQKMYDSLMKSGKFTAAQNKAENGEIVDSISELVMMCEKDGFIPRYYIDTPKDKVDRVLQDLQGYTKSLITEETNIGNLIENAVKQIEEDKRREAETDADAASDEDILEDALFNDDLKYITDGEFEEFSDFEETLKQDDDNFFEDLQDPNFLKKIKPKRGN